MKKIIFGVLSAALILGAGTAVLAAGSDSENGLVNFESMLPFMKEMHPDLDNQELEEMYQACHGTAEEQNAQNQLDSDAENMMNRF